MTTYYDRIIYVNMNNGEGGVGWVSECESCGALVLNPTVHDKFHEELSRTTQSAQRADFFTRPIGGTGLGKI